jgi:hypothetical protein
MLRMVRRRPALISRVDVVPPKTNVTTTAR